MRTFFTFAFVLAFAGRLSAAVAITELEDRIRVVIWDTVIVP